MNEAIEGMDLIPTLRKHRLNLQAVLDTFWNLFDRSQNTSMCYTELQWARAWMGKMLAALGEENPYAAKDGNRKSVEDVLPIADTDDTLRFSLTGNQVEKADGMRQYIEGICKDLEVVLFKGFSTEEELKVTTTFTYSHLRQAKMALGYYFQSLKQKSE